MQGRVCVHACTCLFLSPKIFLLKKFSVPLGLHMDPFYIFQLQDWIVIAWLSRTKLYIFCYMNHYKQQLWGSILGPVIILMKQKDCIPSEVNFSRSQIKMLLTNSKHAGNRAQITGASDLLFGLGSTQATTESQIGPPGSLKLLKSLK